MKRISTLILFLFVLIFSFVNISEAQTPTKNVQEKKDLREHFDFPLVKNEVDEFEKSNKLLVSRLENWVTTKPDGMGNGFDIAIGSVDGVYLLYYYGTQKCLVQGESKISLLLEDENVIDLGYYGDVDCQSTFRKTRFLFLSPKSINNNTSEKDILTLQKSNVDAILSSPVEKVRLYSTDGYTDYQTYEVAEHIEATRLWHEIKVKEATGNIEKQVSEKMYSEFIDDYQSGEIGALYYKIIYDHSYPLDMVETDLPFKTEAEIYLEVTLDSYDESDDLKSYYDYFKGHTKYVLMDMIRVLKDEVEK